MSAGITYSIPSGNVANALTGIASISSLIINGNENLLTANQATSMAKSCSVICCASRWNA